MIHYCLCIFRMIYGTFVQSPFYWYLISGRQKTTFFLFYCFRDLLDVKKFEEKYLISFSPGEGPWAKEASEESHEAPKSTGGAPYQAGRATHATEAHEHRIGLSFLQTTPSRPKSYAIFFPRFTEAAAEAKVLSYSGRGQILLHRSLR